MSEEMCRNTITPAGGDSFRCRLPKGHAGRHVNGLAEWDNTSPTPARSEAAGGKDIQRQAIEKVHRIADDAEARRYGTGRFAHKEIVAVSMALKELTSLRQQLAAARERNEALGDHIVRVEQAAMDALALLEGGENALPAPKITSALRGALSATTTAARASAGSGEGGENG